MRIRQADVVKDRELLIQFLAENLPGQGGAAHYDWLYRDNPHGPARVWIATDEDSDRMIGAAAAFPRLVSVDGEVVRCWNLGDFAIAQGFRSLGPALALQRACLGPVMDGQVPFAYDHPSCTMMAIYRRLGIDAAGSVVRYAKPLRIDDKVKGWARVPIISRSAASVGNLLLSLGEPGTGEGRDFRVSRFEGRFDQRFSDLDQAIAGRLRVVGRRTADYLNWRYLDNPLAPGVVITVEDGKELLGYAVVSVREDVAVLVDFFSFQRSAVVNALLAAVVDIARQDRVQTLSAPVLETHPWIPLLEKWGFRSRETSSFVVSTRAGEKWDGVVTRGKNWFLTHGDRDA